MTRKSVMHPLGGRRFHFDCHQGMPCFTKCCANLNLVLTPYDILRLKNRLHLASDQFLDRFTDDFVDGTSGLPLVRLRMGDDDMRRCPFVSPEGCKLYDDRPAACRLYPLGRAASKMYANCRVGEQYFLVKESHCLGLKQDRQWTVQEWLSDQGMAQYNTMNDLFMDITTAQPLRRLKPFGDRHLKMFYMACYDLDAFRYFIFNSTFRDRFDIGEDVLNRIQTDDVELMLFAFRWLKFSLFGEKAFDIKDHFSRANAI